MKAKQILAILGILLLLGMYACTMIFALMDSPAAKGLLMGAIFCTVAVPVILWFVIRSAEHFQKRQRDDKEAFEDSLAAMRKAESEAVPEAGDSENGATGSSSQNGEDLR